MSRFRIATYNIHKCRGMDRRVQPERIVEVLRRINADVVALQEVVSVEDAAHEMHQARYLADKLGCCFHLGENRRHQGGAYGNVVLSRLPVVHSENYDLSVPSCERRGALRVDVMLPGGTIVHVFNVHFGTAFVERRHQVRRLLSGEILNRGGLSGPRVVLGDFNEWTQGLASRLLASELRSADIRHHLRRTRTYPGLFPFLHLDHMYYDKTLELERLDLHRDRVAVIASDHLPLVAEFRLAAAPAGETAAAGGSATDPVFKSR